MIDYIYSGYAVDLSFPDAIYVDPEVGKTYDLIEIPVVEVLPSECFHVKGSWMITSLCSTSYIDANILNEPHKLTYGWVYYSTDKEKCKQFVSDIRKKNMEYLDKVCRFKSAKLPDSYTPYADPFTGDKHECKSVK